MSATEAHTMGSDPSVGNGSFKLEVQIIPVSDVDRSKEFYQALDWRLDADDAPWTAFASSSSHPPDPAPRSRSARDSRRSRQARPSRD